MRPISQGYFHSLVARRRVASGCSPEKYCCSGPALNYLVRPRWHSTHPAHHPIAGAYDREEYDSLTSSSVDLSAACPPSLLSPQPSRVACSVCADDTGLTCMTATAMTAISHSHFNQGPTAPDYIVRVVTLLRKRAIEGSVRAHSRALY
jgi:hypothetical protein